MNDNTVDVERAILEYKTEKRRRDKRAYIARRKAEGKYKRSKPPRELCYSYEVSHRAKCMDSIPEGLELDMMEWLTRRCMQIKDLARVLGMHAGHVSRMVHRRRNPTDALLKVCGLNYEQGKPYTRKYTGQPFTICGDCNTSTCSWENCGKPVDGWNAKETTVSMGKKKVQSFFVIGCPKYTERANFSEADVGKVYDTMEEDYV